MLKLIPLLREKTLIIKKNYFMIKLKFESIFVKQSYLFSLKQTVKEADYDINVIYNFNNLLKLHDIIEYRIDLLIGFSSS